jgi:hypothetical protein
MATSKSSDIPMDRPVMDRVFGHDAVTQLSHCRKVWANFGRVLGHRWDGHQANDGDAEGNDQLTELGRFAGDPNSGPPRRC